ncbi:hypothetical protein H4R33_006779 [Dimargaris cristalligena]|uniref:RGS domain-containing protein n=1 Tax=Dimargaris cristalligena TaxID=215637 RepID=A0A4P9ZKU4_9FUNG|nr:hypothetical protein H4R33_006779 [Dimargaris cristalligena]RKP33906.1 hypothetical protein BJ085DRAFT_40101 [Dimargaris cristalligena]|eukprot:RKP33906.1 hypothetical protein BJ085DRAFT_40101 [Dimargaris cristalligena]
MPFLLHTAAFAASLDLVRRQDTDSSHPPHLKLYIYISLTIVASVFIIATTALFYHRSSTSRELQRRSVPLTVLTSIAALVTCTLYFLRSVEGFPCFLSHIGSYFGFYFVHTAILTRSIRLIAMARSASTKVGRLLHPDGPVSFWEKHPGLVRIFNDDRRLILYMFIVSSPIIIFAIIPLFVSNEYSFMAHKAECGLDWESYPLIVIAVTYGFIVFPYLIYCLRNIKDAYQMRNNLIITCVSSIVLDIPYLALMLAPKDISYPITPVFFPAVSVLVIQFSAVFIPWLRAQREHHYSNNQALHSPATFFRVMNDPELLSLFCKFCENNFCAELPFFLSDYQRLKAKSVEFMNSEKPIKMTHLRDLTDEPGSSIGDETEVDPYSNPPQSPFNRWFVTKNTVPDKEGESVSLNDVESMESLHAGNRVSPLPETIASDLDEQTSQTVPSELAIDYYCFYERYFADGSIWEVNISGKTLLYLRTLVEREQFSWTMFDPAKDEVSQLLMEDVFNKFLKTNGDIMVHV